MIRHKGRYSLPWMLSGTPSTQDECFPSIRKRNRGRGEGGGGDLALQSAQSQDVQEGKKLEIFILVLNIYWNVTRILSFKKENQARNLRAMASQLFPGGQVLYVYPQRQGLSPACLRGTEELGFISHFRLYFPCFQSQYSKTMRHYVYSYCLLTLTSFLYAHARITAPWPFWYVMNVPFLKISFSITLEKSIPCRWNWLHKSWYMDRVPRNHSEARSLALER